MRCKCAAEIAQIVPPCNAGRPVFAAFFPRSTPFLRAARDWYGGFARRSMRLHSFRSVVGSTFLIRQILCRHASGSTLQSTCDGDGGACRWRTGTGPSGRFAPARPPGNELKGRIRRPLFECPAAGKAAFTDVPKLLLFVLYLAPRGDPAAQARPGLGMNRKPIPFSWPDLPLGRPVAIEPTQISGPDCRMLRKWQKLVPRHRLPRRRDPTG